MDNNVAVVLLSGGQDSITCLFWAKKSFKQVYAVAVYYGQKHSVELSAAQTAADRAGVSLVVLDVPALKQLGNSALLNYSEDINKVGAKQLPASFVPNRNAIFVTLAHAYAQKVGANNVVIGACQTDYSGYPDCRRVFFDKIQMALNLGSEEQVKIHTPLMYIDKADTFQMAEELGCLGLVLEVSRTCYNGGSDVHRWGLGCGVCPACTLRKNGYEKFINRKLTVL